MKICQPAPAAAAEPPALLPQQEVEKRPSMAWTRTRQAWVATAARLPTVLEVLRLVFPWVREQDLGMQFLAKCVSTAENVVAEIAYERAVYRAPVYMKSVVEARIPQFVMPKVPAVPALNPALLPAGLTAISDPHAAATVAIAPAPRATAAAATLAPAPFVPAAGASMAFAAPPATSAPSVRGSARDAGAGAGVNEKRYACKEKGCGETFKTGQGLGGHVASRHRRCDAADERWYACTDCGETFNSGKGLGGHRAGRHRRDKTTSLARAPAASGSSFPHGLATRRKRPAMEAASPGNAKRCCIRLFGVDMAVEAAPLE
jgi:hypothetical protein